MIRALPILVAALLTGSAFAQFHPGFSGSRGYPTGPASTMSMGNVVYPGTGHAPAVRGPAVRRPMGAYGFRGAPPPRRYAHPRHAQTVIIPYPVVVGGYDYGYYDNAYTTQPPPLEDYTDQGAPEQPVTPPIVIINQGYVPETASPVVRDYSNGIPVAPNIQTIPPPEQNPNAEQNSDDEKPTTYLIAFKDRTILPALAYWVEGDTLHYITLDGEPNSASLSLIDKDLSTQLNQQRRVEFKLPK
jgi:hypothetical protein